MLVGWMVVYILSYVSATLHVSRYWLESFWCRYPVYSFFLPIYSFWCMDDFSWGNTRLVIGEGNNKKILMNEDEKFDDSMIPLKKFSGKSYCGLVKTVDWEYHRIWSRSLGNGIPSFGWNWLWEQAFTRSTQVTGTIASQLSSGLAVRRLLPWYEPDHERFVKS